MDLDAVEAVVAAGVAGEIGQRARIGRRRRVRHVDRELAAGDLDGLERGPDRVGRRRAGRQDAGQRGELHLADQLRARGRVRRAQRLLADPWILDGRDVALPRLQVGDEARRRPPGRRGRAVPPAVAPAAGSRSTGSRPRRGTRRTGTGRRRGRRRRARRRGSCRARPRRPARCRPPRPARAGTARPRRRLRLRSRADRASTPPWRTRRAAGASGDSGERLTGMPLTWIVVGASTRAQSAARVGPATGSSGCRSGSVTMAGVPVAARCRAG